MSTIGIPEGFDLLAGRNRENAKKALATAVERGFPESSVLTYSGNPSGYLIPSEADAIEAEPGTEGDEPDAIEAEKIELPAASATKSEQEAFAAEHGIDLSETTNAETRHAAIQAWAENLPVLGGDETQKEN